MPPAWDHSRRRAEDVFKVVEDEVFPRLGAIDTKISNLEQGVGKLMVEGCAHREGDLTRTVHVENSMGKIFGKIDDLGDKLGEYQLDVTKQIGNIRSWVLTGLVIVLVCVVGFFLTDLFTSVKGHIGK